ncbi:hypothetical protein DFP74_5724 [Nocardiopsis sp. Huas11]|uniref:hypothetical protein n=1 Tax=Nocardiopsis sp. Huas11 TaxID=2183912 RepID=UPI000F237E83|nr:hypothetical protein [Nocardiopsis sp. Huas11]RKS09978.1 hypothetical protein DFP74_5724 [Nocardiopsis sp. Huas11]
MQLATAPTLTDWIGAGASVVAAIGGAGTLIIALILIIKQYRALSVTIDLSGKQEKALVATTEALNDEMAHRREDRLRQAVEAEERRWEQARKVRLLPFWGWPEKGDTDPLSAFLRPSGLSPRDLTTRFKVINRSDDRIRHVIVGVDQGPSPSCYLSHFERSAQVIPMPVLPPDEEARFYWKGAVTVSPLEVFVEFTDGAGARWRLHHRDGLSVAPRDE